MPDDDIRRICAADNGKSVFLFPGIVGSLNGYGNLVTALAGLCNIYGLAYPRDPDHRASPLLQFLGAYCARRICDCGITGPTCLVGWSMGGLVAYECGVALQAAGHTAAAVILVDASPNMVDLAPTPSAQTRDADLRAFMWTQFLEMKIGRAAMQESVAVGNFLQLSEREKFRVVRRHERKWTTNLSPPLGLRACLRFMTAAHLAMEQYVPSPYPGTFHAIFSAEYATTVAPNWRKAGAPGCLPMGVKGDHLTAMLHFAIAPIVEIVSRLVSAA